MTTDVVVCASCFADPDLRGVVEACAREKECSFCGATADEDIAAPLDDVVDHMRECLRAYYDDAANQLGWVGSEGGYQGLHWDSYDLLSEEIGLELPNDDGELLSAIANRLSDQIWCEANGYSLAPDDRLRMSWDEFCNLIKHRKRFFFLGEPRRQGSELLDAASVLETIADYVQKTGLIRPIAAGTTFFRARSLKPGAVLSTPKDLGPPSEDKAVQSNRMSPPGIVMFYVSDHPETALRETATDPGNYVVAEFTSTKELRILDLMELPPIPGIFAPISDSLPYNPRHVLIFLDRIAAEISKPIARDDRVHVSYVPTQVVTEFFRSYELEDGSRIDGIRYESTRHPGHASLVLFADQRDLIVPESELPEFEWPKHERWIQLIGSQQIAISGAEMESWKASLGQMSFDDLA